MPRIIAWTLLAQSLPQDDATMLLESLKAYIVEKSDLSACNICASSAPHNMRTRLLRCSCPACEGDNPFGRCRWRGKTQQCSALNIVNVWENGMHLSPRRVPRTVRLTEPMKEVVREMTTHNHKPLRIRNALLRRFQLDETTLPSLQTVQRFVQRYRTTHLGGSDYIDDVRSIIRENGFKGEEDWCDPFTFSWTYDRDGNPVVGSGADDDAFIVGMTSKRLLERANRDPATFMLHVDTTFKLNLVDYPVMVVGISDCMRTFHLIAIFVMSQRTAFHCTEAFSALRSIYSTVVGKPLRVKFVMTDADEAQLNAFEHVFGKDVVSVMCYFHVAAKVYERTRSLSPPFVAKVLNDVASLHFTPSAGEYERTRHKTSESWASRPELSAFATYFTKQWTASRFNRWQVFVSPPGFATTNNPVEQFNRAIKRDYTLSARLKMGTLVEQLLQCCKVESLKVKAFADKTVPTPSLERRVRELRRAGRIREHGAGRASIRFLLDDENVDGLPETTYVQSERCDTIYDPEAKRTREALPVTARMRCHTAQMEVDGMPEGGWPVNYIRLTCPCKYWMKYACCIHVVFALHARGQLNLFRRDKLVYRGRNKSRRVATAQDSGRPVRNSHALNTE
ncbi:hypothetical protein PHMEG_00022098 [Phytophthora megakarya]|uniref:MULE transposase domain-containing protein n=1 Tax=Phytophthora megakarya TaxID=4795 RepID=A0A225VLK5_9STRA|nr:hypothetical protein PHMEG_00022098 [Phytophthora megakarya]